MDYKIIVGDPPDADSCRHFQFDYGSVKKIVLLLEEKKLSIECKMKAKKNADQIFTDRNNHFSEALKKGILFHLLLYSKPLSTEDIRIYVDDEELTGWSTKNSPVIYSLIEENLEPSLPSKWKETDAVFQYFCKNHESQQKDIAASLYALLYAKTRRNETERFLYLWMSMNGLYNHLAKVKFPKKEKEDNENRIGDLKKMQILADAENWGNKLLDNYGRRMLIRSIDEIYRDYDFKTKEFIDALGLKIPKLTSKNGKRYDITVDGCLYLCYPYYLRCNLFHADKPLALFSLKHEFEIECLRFVNERLETYLEHNLYLYFDENYCKARLGLSSEGD